MMRMLLASLALILAFAAEPAAAQKQRAYAPEDMSQLSTSEQVYAIEREYREQSGGRSIPDDQLDFYLDMIRMSRWTFSRIKSDIAQSLRGSGGGGWRPPAGGGWQQRDIICSSSDRRYRECRTPYRGPARLVAQLSETRCIEGRNWGSRPGLVWVDEGCRARFSEDRGGWPTWPGGPGGQREVICQSEDMRYRQCNTGFRGPARLVRKLSDAACIEGRSWGQGPGYVWVARGCRAKFEDSGWGGGGGNWGYSVTCSSDDGRYRTCAWIDRNGRPRLMEQLSKTACVEGRTWGYRNGQIWVDNGCRGRFGVSR